MINKLFADTVVICHHEKLYNGQLKQSAKKSFLSGVEIFLKKNYGLCRISSYFLKKKCRVHRAKKNGTMPGKNPGLRMAD